MQRLKPYFIELDDHQIDVTLWGDLVSASMVPSFLNCFGDIFLSESDGSIYMLDISLGQLKEVAESQAEFERSASHDIDEWLMRALVDRCIQAGLSLTEGKCYAFKLPPILGGKHELATFGFLQ